MMAADMATTNPQARPPLPRTTSLRRGNSLAFPKPLRTLSLPPSFDVELPPVESGSLPSYTSIRDVISKATASAVVSWRDAAAASSRYQIPIRNQLVKQAARAYLQPMSSSSLVSSSRSRLFLHRLWNHVLSWRPLVCIYEFYKGCIFPMVRKILDRIRGAIRWLIAR
ncbi:hypothetical protein MLD38_015997 [Melastoma candidum]|uniref:Uncharacterized protein n=1 Tax=Melastoma candidum TaxID=119954 RepID=A0ACB9RIL5_9MYRT|nr:hypothetical protein MLD38_015997 [Melastoma candidum]